MESLDGLKIAILVTNGFEQVEMTQPRRALEDAGAEADIVSPAQGEVQGWKHHDKADKFKVDVPLEHADASQFDALMLPGGVVNPDALRLDDKAISFIKHFIDHGKPIAAICHGPWPLINAEGVRDHTMTSWPSLKIDLMNAGANWVDEEVCVDGKLVTSRKPADLPAFNREMVKMFAAQTQAAAATYSGA